MHTVANGFILDFSHQLWDYAKVSIWQTAKPLVGKTFNIPNPLYLKYEINLGAD